MLTEFTTGLVLGGLIGLALGIPLAMLFPVQLKLFLASAISDIRKNHQAELNAIVNTLATTHSAQIEEMKSKLEDALKREGIKQVELNAVKNKLSQYAILFAEAVKTVPIDIPPVAPTPLQTIPSEPLDILIAPVPYNETTEIRDSTSG